MCNTQNEKPADTLEIRVYKGADAKFELYEDEGDNYNYEAGKYTIISFAWNEKRQTLTIEGRRGGYPGSLATRIFNVVFVDENKGFGINVGSSGKEVTYVGAKVEVKLGE